MKDSLLIKKGHFTVLAIVLMIALPLVIGILCMCAGRMKVPVSDVINALASLITGEKGNIQNYSIIVRLRLPRILMAIIVGAGLTCAGDTFQALFSNPLATPDILGVTSGTCVGAILAIIMSRGILETQLIALVPFDIRISVIVQRGVAGLNWSAAASVFDCLAQRLEGKHIPLAFKG